MKIKLPLDKMTIAEKLQTMETIWNNLMRRSAEFPTPPWHKDILKKREENIINKEDHFTSWEKAKKKIRNTVQ
ncbi:MAG: addiction module protein [Candidatus Marinimicrobia bacterium]|nr:addiction module protein [Candidatus Neomarinimicrobiota bacterium]